MKKSFLLFAVTVCLLLLNGGINYVSAQTTIYSQNFDTVFALPSGWSSSSWAIDSGNSSSGYTGASGNYNIVIQNQTAPAGFDTLYSNTISTTGYSAITAIWAARNTNHFSDSGSAIQGFYWSADGGTTWNNVAYIENGNNSTWSVDNNNTVISLPVGAANQATLQFAWVAKIVTAPSGTYRIDDFNVKGTPSTGIAVLDENLAKVYMLNGTTIYIVSGSAGNEKMNVEIYDVTGRLVNQLNMNSSSLSVDASLYTSGIYLVKVSNSSVSTTSRVFVK